MAEPITNAQGVFSTNNLTLAVALTAAGCQAPEDEGRALMGLNQYSLGFIRAQKDKTGEPLCGGMTHEAAVKFLWKIGTPGNVVYFFTRTDELTRILKGWDSQGATLDAGGAMETGVSEEDFGRIAKQLAKVRADFIGSKSIVPLWRRRDEAGNLFIPAVKHNEGTSSTETSGDRTTRTIRGAKIEAVAV